MGFLRDLIFSPAPKPPLDVIDGLLRRVWSWKGPRHELLLDDGWQGFGPDEFRTLILKPSETERLHFRYAPARRSAWIRVQTRDVVFESRWTGDAWLVDRFLSLERMLEQLPEHPAVIGLYGTNEKEGA